MTKGEPRLELEIVEVHAMRTQLLPALWANLGPPSYRVEIPASREPVYEYAAPVFLSLAIVAGGLWIARSRSIRTPLARTLLWVFAGCLAVSLTAHWIWVNRHSGTVESSLASAPFVRMPLVWTTTCAILIAAGWRMFRPSGRSTILRFAEATSYIVASSLLVVSFMVGLVGQEFSICVIPVFISIAVIVAIESLKNHNGDQSEPADEPRQVDETISP
jgi:hypothetical protein